MINEFISAIEELMYTLYLKSNEKIIERVEQDSCLLQRQENYEKLIESCLTRNDFENYQEFIFELKMEYAEEGYKNGFKDGIRLLYYMLFREWS